MFLEDAAAEILPTRLVLDRDEPRHGLASLRDDDRFARLANPIEDLQTLGLELTGRDPSDSHDHVS